MARAADPARSAARSPQSAATRCSFARHRGAPLRGVARQALGPVGARRLRELSEEMIAATG
ncbi:MULTISPECIES: hypothetical protein [unclassified Streptomyces]|uniref:hypothetical protein n=1 Tax=unclassified Streptomyces TaxID=2593676 RepID=UPI00331797C3